ncbi:sulfite oxidase-like oxidoreductase [Sphingoaurantiacus capsulatus]|uniref:Sulfite oxidase-like oxidoreductase n=1 Tax=Sphingoaurantiacus capsulatus TaxID=1771310 RepID=A0ABV7XC15_9SPHN
MADGFKDKLIATKQAWARAGRLLTGTTGDPETDRLPPGQRLVENWPVLDLGIQPDVPKADWRLTIDGAVDNPVTWDWDAFMAQPQAEDVSDIHCVTQWSRYDNRWTGVSTRHVIDLVKPTPQAAHVVFHSYDGYTTNVSLAAFAEEDCLIAHSHDGVPIGREHGGPARLIIPRYYLWKSAKWVKHIEFLAADQPGFWEVRGYHNVGDPWLEQRYG